MGRLEGKVVVVTGGAQGIGAAYACAVAEQGAKVAVGDIADTTAIEEQLKTRGAKFICQRLDVTDPGSVRNFSETVSQELGGVSVLINNAAIFASIKTQPFAEISSDDWDKVMAVNVRGSFECVKAMVPAMRTAGGGSIINIASGTVFKGMPNFLHYVTSKGAIVAFTRCLARELGEDLIRVNCIAPGLVMSEGVVSQGIWTGEKLQINVATRALKRAAEPDDLLGAVVFLASDESAFITGQTLVIDGGSVMH